jgi:hypothetical protein
MRKRSGAAVAPGAAARAAAVALAAALLAGVFATGCSGSESVGQWASGAGILGPTGTVAYIAGDIGLIDRARRSHDMEELKTHCDSLSDDAATGYSWLPAPTTRLTNDLNVAYTSFGKAVNYCLSGVNGSATALAKSNAEIKKGERALARAEAILGSASS